MHGRLTAIARDAAPVSAGPSPETARAWLVGCRDTRWPGRLGWLPWPSRSPLRWRRLAEDAQAGQPRLRALLVGVSRYDNLPERLWLHGPPNDIVLMRDTLLSRGFAADRVTVLAESGGSGRPVRAAILGELDQLADTAAPQDLILLYFSGHGSQQPDDDPPATAEPDGMDEIFLPADVGQWSGSVGKVENAIVDDEMGARIATMRRRGAFVWLVADSCKSGNLMRAVPAEGEVDRLVRPEDLGIPAAAIERARTSAPSPERADKRERGLGAQGDEALAGGFVGFYAAQGSELAPELKLPTNAADAKQYGLFTFSLAGILRGYPGITYRQFGQQILANYAAILRTVPTPLFEGKEEDLGHFVLGQPAQSPRQWPVKVDGPSWSINAGRLLRIDEGTILALVPGPAAADQETLGHVRVSSSAPDRSVIEGMPYLSEPAPTKLPAGAWARVVDGTFKTALTVALPPRPRRPLSARELRAQDEIERLRSTGFDQGRRQVRGLDLGRAGPGRPTCVFSCGIPTRPKPDRATIGSGCCPHRVT